jgi:hypothetical protein
MTDDPTLSEAQAEVQVQAAVDRAGLRVSAEQLARFVKTHRHMQARLAVLRSQLDPSVPPALVFPAAAVAEATSRGGG